jgi:hypothetical protein
VQRHTEQVTKKAEGSVLVKTERTVEGQAAEAAGFAEGDFFLVGFSAESLEEVDAAAPSFFAEGSLSPESGFPLDA